MNKEDVSQELLKARQWAGLSRKQLSDMTGVSQSVIQKYEDNVTRYSIHTFLKICEALELDPVELLDKKAGRIAGDAVSNLGMYDDLPEDLSPEDLQERINDVDMYYLTVEDEMSVYFEEFFKEKYKDGYFKELIADSALRVYRKSRGLSPEGWEMELKEKLPDFTHPMYYPEETVVVADGSVRVTPRLYSTVEMIETNIRYLNELGKEKLFNSLCDLLKDPANLLKKPTDSEKDE